MRDVSGPAAAERAGGHLAQLLPGQRRVELVPLHLPAVQLLDVPNKVAVRIQNQPVHENNSEDEEEAEEEGEAPSRGLAGALLALGQAAAAAVPVLANRTQRTCPMSEADIARRGRSAVLGQQAAVELHGLVVPAPPPALRLQRLPRLAATLALGAAWARQARHIVAVKLGAGLGLVEANRADAHRPVLIRLAVLRAALTAPRVARAWCDGLGRAEFAGAGSGDSGHPACGARLALTLPGL